MYRFLVCDRNLSVYRQIKSFILEAFHEVAVYYIDDIEGWQEKLESQMSENSESDSQAPKDDIEWSSQPVFAGVPKVTIEASGINGSLDKVKDDYKGTFLGFDFKEWAGNELFWRGQIDKSHTEALNRYFNNLRLEDKNNSEFHFQNSKGELHRLELNGKTLPSDEGEVRFEIQIIDRTPTGAEPEKEEDEEETHIDIIFLEASFAQKDPLQQTEKILEEFREFNQTFSPKLILCGPEDHLCDSSEFALATVDDFFYKPLDELLCLDKVHSLIPGIKRKSEEPFLFSSEVEFQVEVAQEQNIMAMSSYGVKLTCPFPIRSGVTLKMYSALFGANHGLWASCYHTEPLGSSHINEMTWFALLPDESRVISDWCLENAPPEKMLSDQEKLEHMRKSREKKKGPVIHGAASKPKKTKNIVVIDLDDETSKNITESIESMSDQYRVHPWGSIRQAAADLFPGVPTEFPSLEEDEILSGDTADYEMLWSERPAFAPQNELQFVIDAEFNFVEFRDFPQAGSLLFGDQGFEWTEQTDLWRQRISPKDKFRLRDFLGYIGSGQSAKAEFLFLRKDERHHKIKVSAQPIADRDEILISMEDLTNPSSAEIDGSQSTISDMHLMVIDYSYISYRPTQWLRRLRELIDNQELNPKKQKTKIVIVAPKKTITQVGQFNGFVADGFISKPLEKTRLLQLLELVENDNRPNPQYSFHRWVPTSHYVDIARPSKAKNMGEKGLSLINAKPVSIGAWARFYHPSLLDESGRGLLARCYRSEENKDGLFDCHFAFFGISESQLKNIRKLWVAGDEIKNEQGEDGTEEED